MLAIVLYYFVENEISKIKKIRGFYVWFVNVYDVIIYPHSEIAINFV